jgi:hypothetical protein
MKNRDLESFIIQLVNQDSPFGITRRGIFYKVVSAGFYPGTERKHYNKLGSVLGKLRGEEKLNEDNILDSTRIRRIPYIFNSPAGFLADVENQYAKDLWENQPIHLEVFSEKDAMSSVLETVTDKYRVHYNMIRGYVSESAVYRIVKTWMNLAKPIHALYVGDHDPSGLNLESSIRHKIVGKILKLDDTGYRDFGYIKGLRNQIRAKLAVISKRIIWQRIASSTKDLDTYSGSLILCKGGDTRTPAYMAKYGNRCLEVDAIDMQEIVSRLEKAILKRIDPTAWKKSEEEEVKEQEKLSKAIAKISKQF